MVIENVVEWIIIPVIGGGGGALVLMAAWIRHNRKDSEARDDQLEKDVDSKHEKTQKDIVHFKHDLSHYQVETEKRLGEYIRREELHGILDRVEERIEKQMNDLKDMLRQVIDKR